MFNRKGPVSKPQAVTGPERPPHPLSIKAFDSQIYIIYTSWMQTASMLTPGTETCELFKQMDARVAILAEITYKLDGLISDFAITHGPSHPALEEVREIADMSAYEKCNESDPLILCLLWNQYTLAFERKHFATRGYIKRGANLMKQELCRLLHVCTAMEAAWTTETKDIVQGGHQKAHKLFATEDQFSFDDGMAKHEVEKARIQAESKAAASLFGEDLLERLSRRRLVILRCHFMADTFAIDEMIRAFPNSLVDGEDSTTYGELDLHQIVYLSPPPPAHALEEFFMEPFMRQNMESVPEESTSNAAAPSSPTLPCPPSQTPSFSSPCPTPLAPSSPLAPTSQPKDRAKRYARNLSISSSSIVPRAVSPFPILRQSIMMDSSQTPYEPPMRPVPRDESEESLLLELPEGNGILCDKYPRRDQSSPPPAPSPSPEPPRRLRSERSGFSLKSLFIGPKTPVPSEPTTPRSMSTRFGSVRGTLERLRHHPPLEPTRPRIVHHASSAPTLVHPIHRPASQVPLPVLVRQQSLNRMRSHSLHHLVPPSPAERALSQIFHPPASPQIDEASRWTAREPPRADSPELPSPPTPAKDLRNSQSLANVRTCAMSIPATIPEKRVDRLSLQVDAVRVPPHDQFLQKFHRRRNRKNKA